MKFQTIFVEGKESWIRIGSDDKTTFFKQHPLLVHLDSEKKIKRSDMQQPFTLKKWKNLWQSCNSTDNILEPDYVSFSVLYFHSI